MKTKRIFLIITYCFFVFNFSCSKETISNSKDVSSENEIGEIVNSSSSILPNEYVQTFVCRGHK